MTEVNEKLTGNTNVTIMEPLPFADLLDQIEGKMLNMDHDNKIVEHYGNLPGRVRVSFDLYQLGLYRYCSRVLANKNTGTEAVRIPKRP